MRILLMLLLLSALLLGVFQGIPTAYAQMCLPPTVPIRRCPAPLICNPQTNMCVLPPGAAPRIAPVPTLSEWGLIATAAMLGIVSVLVIRKRKARA